MKKYTIKDNQGYKKTIYADSLSHAIKLNDEDVVRIIGIRYGKFIVMNASATKTLSPKFDDVDDAKEWIKKNYPRAKVIDSKTRDEASLATTLNALINDEKAAIDAYNVVIKNLEGKIDEIQMQVLINIMKDERRHVENLYAILNGQVTEKNLEDSVHDSTKSDLFKAIDKLYAKYGNLDLLRDTELDNAIKELATSLPDVKYDDFKDVIENFIGERRLRERMKRSGLTYFKR